MVKPKEDVHSKNTRMYIHTCGNQKSLFFLSLTLNPQPRKNVLVQSSFGTRATRRKLEQRVVLVYPQGSKGAMVLGAYH